MDEWLINYPSNAVEWALIVALPFKMCNYDIESRDTSIFNQTLLAPPKG